MTEHILKPVNKCLKGCTPQHFKQYFTYNRDIMTRTTRQSNLLHLPRVRLETTKKSFFYNGCIVLIVLNDHVNIDFIGYLF